MPRKKQLVFLAAPAGELVKHIVSTQTNTSKIVAFPIYAGLC
jgi:hypothetical protein